MSLKEFFRKIFSNEPMSTGFLERPVQERDYIAGSSPIEHEIRIFDGNWISYATDFEYQKQNGFETMSCVSQSGINAVQMQINWMIDNAKLSQEIMDFLVNNKYLVDGHIQASKRFIAIMSETTPRGNYLTKVAQTIRDYGLIPEYLLPFEGNDWDTYYNKQKITEQMFDIGKQFAKYFPVQYEWTVTPNMGGLLEDQRSKVLHELKHTPLQIAQTGHATDYYNGVESVRFGILDSYHPFLKDKKWNNDAPWVLKILVNTKSEYTEAEISNAKIQVLSMVKQHGNKYFFTPDIVELDGKKLGKAYMVFEDGTFKYGTAKGTIFRQMCIDWTIVPVGNELFKSFKPAEIK